MVLAIPFLAMKKKFGYYTVLTTSLATALIGFDGYFVRNSFEWLVGGIMSLESAKVPPEMNDIFSNAEKYVKRYFSNFKNDIKKGGIFISGASPTISECIITGNSAEHGGAISRSPGLFGYRPDSRPRNGKTGRPTPGPTRQGMANYH
jgi:hypothetical protein